MIKNVMCLVALFFSAMLTCVHATHTDLVKALEMTYTGTVNNYRHVYTTDEMNTYVREDVVEEIVKVRDKCQFTPDIEDRARLVKMPVFEYVFGQMLINGTCVKQDAELGIDYVKRSLEHGYSFAALTLGQYYELGFVVPKDRDLALRLYRLASQLGNSHAVLAYVDLLLILQPEPPAQYVQEAYGWLSNAVFLGDKTYFRYKQKYLLRCLEQLKPKNSDFYNK